MQEEQGKSQEQLELGTIGRPNDPRRWLNLERGSFPPTPYFVLAYFHRAYFPMTTNNDHSQRSQKMTLTQQLPE